LFEPLKGKGHSKPIKFLGFKVLAFFYGEIKKFLTKPFFCDRTQKGLGRAKDKKGVKEATKSFFRNLQNRGQGY